MYPFEFAGVSLAANLHLWLLETLQGPLTLFMVSVQRGGKTRQMLNTMHTIKQI